MSVNDWHEATGLLVDVVLLIGAIGAVIKFRLFNVLSFRWRSDLKCGHYLLSNSSIIFAADYTINNTGQRPLRLKNVTIRLTGAREEGALLMPDENRTYVTRIFESGDPALPGRLFEIEPGERTIFTLRAQLATLDDAVFVLCEFSLKKKCRPGTFRGFYAKSNPTKAESS